jgi:hypothetical protein
MADSYKLKMAVISGASNALKFKDKNPNATEQEILQHITDNASEIIAKIEDSEF